MSYQRKIIEEHYDHQARVQLDFKSYLKVSMFMIAGFAVANQFVMLSLSENITSPHAIQDVFIWSFLNILMYLPIGFIGAVAAYPIYNWWCSKRRGQVMSGRFAMLREANEKSAETD